MVCGTSLVMPSFLFFLYMCACDYLISASGSYSEKWKELGRVLETPIVGTGRKIWWQCLIDSPIVPLGLGFQLHSSFLPFLTVAHTYPVASVIEVLYLQLENGGGENKKPVCHFLRRPHLYSMLIKSPCFWHAYSIDLSYKFCACFFFSSRFDRSCLGEWLTAMSFLLIHFGFLLMSPLDEGKRRLCNDQ